MYRNPIGMLVDILIFAVKLIVLNGVHFGLMLGIFTLLITPAGNSKNDIIAFVFLVASIIFWALWSAYLPLLTLGAVEIAASSTGHKVYYYVAGLLCGAIPGVVIMRLFTSEDFFFLVKMAFWISVGIYIYVPLFDVALFKSLPFVTPISKLVAG